MSSPEKIRDDLEDIKSELGRMGGKLRTSANEGNLPIGSISIVVFQAIPGTVLAKFVFSPRIEPGFVVFI